MMIYYTVQQKAGAMTALLNAKLQAPVVIIHVRFQVLYNTLNGALTPGGWMT